MNVMQEAEQALEYWGEHSFWGRLILRDLDANDLDALAFHVKEACSEQKFIESADLIATQVTNWLITGKREGEQ